MTDLQTRADKPRRALVADSDATTSSAPQRARKATRAVRSASPNRLRKGLAVLAVSGIGITAIGVMAATNNSPLLAFANPGAARDAGADRDASRPPLTPEQLLEQREKDLSENGEAITTKVGVSAADDRQSALSSSATQIGTEAERLRNLADFFWPTDGGVGSPWGMRLHPILHYYRLHAGEDIGGACGQPIWAAQTGTVIKAEMGGYNGGSGNNVRIDHGDINGAHVETAYLHMSKIVVKDGEKVNKGQLIGNVGNTGLSTACHLHLALYKNGSNVDPSEYVHKPSAKKNEPATKDDPNSADRELGATNDSKTPSN